jgi:hypothetical protein
MVRPLIESLNRRSHGRPPRVPGLGPGGDVVDSMGEELVAAPGFSLAFAATSAST